MKIGALIFEQIDQADFTGPFEVLSRLPGSGFLVIGKTRDPVRDVCGLLLTPTVTLDDAPPLDVLVIPGGAGVNRLLEDPDVLAFVRRQAVTARCVLSVCTGALLCGAAGLLAGRRATTHWASHDFLAAFGAIPVADRVVIDGNLVFAAGVTSGIDAALRVAALVAGEECACEIQLYLEYAPEPPFDCGSPASAGPDTVAAVRDSMREVLADRAEIVRRIATQGEMTGTPPAC